MKRTLSKLRIKLALALLGKNEREAVLTIAVSKLFCTVTTDDLLRLTPQGWMNGARTLHPEEIKLLGAEAAQFTNTKLWSVLQTDVRYQASKKMFTESQDVLDITAGKLLLYMLDVLKTRLDKLSGLNK